MMKTIAVLFTLLALSVPQGRAGVLILFDNPDLTGGLGDTLTFSGVISNGGSDTVYLNNDSINLLGSSFTIGDLFGNTPLSLDPGASSDDIALFTVTLNDPFTDPAGTYPGTYTILGGGIGAQDNIGSSAFSVTYAPAPEPTTAALFGGSLLALIVLYRRAHTGRARQSAMGATR